VHIQPLPHQPEHGENIHDPAGLFFGFDDEIQRFHAEAGIELRGVKSQHLTFGLSLRAWLLLQGERCREVSSAFGGGLSNRSITLRLEDRVD
jgi:hypothetical protein